MNHSVLLVEDNPQDEILTLRALRKIDPNLEVVVVRDGQEALDYLLGLNHSTQASSQFPKVVLLDINLPKVNGLDVLSKVRANRPTQLLPIVMWSSSDDANDRTQSYSRGANGYVRKPVNFAEFTQAVVHLGQYWLSTNEAPPVGVHP